MLTSHLQFLLRLLSVHCILLQSCYLVLEVLMCLNSTYIPSTDIVSEQKVNVVPLDRMRYSNINAPISSLVHEITLAMYVIRETTSHGPNMKA